MLKSKQSLSYIELFKELFASPFHFYLYESFALTKYIEVQLVKKLTFLSFIHEML